MAYKDEMPMKSKKGKKKSAKKKMPAFLMKGKTRKKKKAAE